jgi:hypothetical protein
MERLVEEHLQLVETLYAGSCGEVMRLGRQRLVSQALVQIDPEAAVEDVRAVAPPLRQPARGA